VKQSEHLVLEEGMNNVFQTIIVVWAAKLL